MKKVTGYINCRPLGSFDFEFMVPDEMTNEEIMEKIKEKNECYIHFDVDPGYEEVTKTITEYVKR